MEIFPYESFVLTIGLSRLGLRQKNNPFPSKETGY